jgi:hypothetical protein
VVFYLLDENKILKNNRVTIESNIDLTSEYNALLNKKVTINYYNADIFRKIKRLQNFKRNIKS